MTELRNLDKDHKWAWVTALIFTAMASLAGWGAISAGTWALELATPGWFKSAGWVLTAVLFFMGWMFCVLALMVGVSWFKRLQHERIAGANNGASSIRGSKRPWE